MTRPAFFPSTRARSGSSGVRRPRAFRSSRGCSGKEHRQRNEAASARARSTARSIARETADPTVRTAARSDRAPAAQPPRKSRTPSQRRGKSKTHLDSVRVPATSSKVGCRRLGPRREKRVKGSESYEEAGLGKSKERMGKVRMAIWTRESGSGSVSADEVFTRLRSSHATRSTSRNVFVEAFVEGRHVHKSSNIWIIGGKGRGACARDCVHNDRAGRNEGGEPWSAGYQWDGGRGSVVTSARQPFASVRPRAGACQHLCV